MAYAVFKKQISHCLLRNTGLVQYEGYKEATALREKSRGISQVLTACPVSDGLILGFHFLELNFNSLQISILKLTPNNYMN